MNFTLQIEQEEFDFIAACINNEKWAQKKLYEDNYSSMYALSLRYASNKEDALDILHEGFIKVFKNIYKFQQGTSVTAWIRRIIINTAIDFYRRDTRRKEDNIEEAYYISSSDEDALSKLATEEILSALQQLSLSYRSVFNLFAIEGYSHKEIAEILHINESTCRSNLVKARNKLKAILLEADKNVI